MGLKTLFASIK